VSAMANGSALARYWKRIADSDVYYSFRTSRVTKIAGIVTAVIFIAAFLAPLIAVHDPYNPANLNLSDAMKSPIFGEKRFWLCPFGLELAGEACAKDYVGTIAHPFGTDDQGRDLYSAMLYGTRLSIVVGIASVAVAMLLGITLGLISGYVGGGVDAFIMRVADVQLTFPAFLIALTLDGVVRGLIEQKVLPFRHDEVALIVIIASLGLSYWPQYARTVRGTVMVERTKDYVNAARIIGVRPSSILVRHILPNAAGPVLVIATINLALAIITEATLSFLGVGMPPTQPSLGTLIRVGNDYLQSGEWWITVMPGLLLAVLVVAVNLLGDWLRDVLNPKLR
jgi:peptide/nickel transport system permease protein